MAGKKIDRTLPNYSRGEEIFNMVTHIVGGSLGIVVFISTIIKAAWNHNTIGIVTSAIYGVTMVLLYSMSSIYHGLTNEPAKKVFRILDHCTIYFLIAGTSTPVMLVSLRMVNPNLAWALFGIEWGLAALAITFTAIDIKRYQAFSMVCYIVMGWCVVVAVEDLIKVLSTNGFALLLVGGLLYTIGAVLYGIGKKFKFVHGIFHIFVLLGSFFQFLCIYIYVL